MQDVTARIEEAQEILGKLVDDAEAGLVRLPELPRVKIAGLLLEGILEGTRRRERRRGSIPRGGLDNSVPAGDRA
ncbi:MAG: hypothetical protein AB7E51_06695 [Pseudodesulfovibrio sp.]|uniref:hypothetical protein n=1 Tax=Pseudodesulfovibrio sp. TaxID=2035812 RepID=UPI003D0E4A1C